MKSLVIVAHGSRRPESNREVIELAKQIETLSEGTFASVRCAFIQFGGPPFHPQIDELVVQGARTIVIVPFFISSGSHVSEDIPKLLQEAGDRHPTIQFVLLPHLAKIDGIVQLILEKAKKAI